MTFMIKPPCASLCSPHAHCSSFLSLGWTGSIQVPPDFALAHPGPGTFLHCVSPWHTPYSLQRCLPSPYLLEWSYSLPRGLPIIPHPVLLSSWLSPLSEAASFIFSSVVTYSLSASPNAASLSPRTFPILLSPHHPLCLARCRAPSGHSRLMFRMNAMVSRLDPCE